MTCPTSANQKCAVAIPAIVSALRMAIADTDDGALYRIHRSLFQQHCPQFVAKNLQELSEKVMLLRDVASRDFQRFLSMVYPSEIGGCDIRSVDEWTSILRIATRLSIPPLYARAIREIESTATPIDKAVIAREFYLGESWLLPAFTEICEADRWLDYEDAKRLGLRTVVEIGRIREEQRSARDFAAAVRASPVLGSLEYIPSPSLPSTDTLPGYSVASPQGLTSTDNTVTDQTPLSSVVRDVEGPETDRIPSRQNDLGIIHAGIMDISNRLAHSTLRQLEMAEAANVRDYFYPTICALELAHRIETDKSPASVMQLGWRQARLEQFIHAELRHHPGQEKDVVASNYSESNSSACIQAAEHPLARIAARQLLQRGYCTCGTFDATPPLTPERLVIRNFPSAKVKEQAEMELRKYGLVVSDIEGANTMSICVEVPARLAYYLLTA
ncbi:uncharacterized protein SCHCODRAFT_02335099 [Schizophyllum commune H4-8]|uniref:uncharacterized protein n=1 Tax=Schizophyllum commune (strain H4-8 / FGSC 9210) TaxID=578458 RepID=UPI00215F1C5B|nr:uncharacterized protein SCHCODRAFT_02335099 [Schizophyllum commune H4-8]KAI5890046.1 hypothetical protein SCHCODRAFT_02335099 [Schizophyllum commune H4-8]